MSQSVFSSPSRLVIVLFLLGLVPVPGFAVEALDLAKAASSITTDELKRHVEVLADDTLEGREAGSRGGQAAANYLVKEFQKQKLVPAGDNKSYFQGFNGYCRNILGVMEGSDPKLKEEVVILGAHYDHVGYGRQGNSYGPLGYIHNGADDNASGVAGLLEVVDAIRQLPAAPKRTILFALWDAEEQGLIGSRFWISRPTLPLSRVVLCLNVDMIGRLKNDRVEVYGTRTLAGSRRLLAEENADTKLALDFDWQIKADSDHHPFFTQSIPILMLHTGLHENYHRPSDDTHLINAEGMQRVTRLTLQTVLRYADLPAAGKFRQESRSEGKWEQAAVEQSQAAPPPRFGLPWQKAAGEKLQIVMLAPIAGSPAEAAGIKAGDKLTQFEGQSIEDEDLLRLQLLAARGPKRFILERDGEKEPLELTIEPRGEPIRLGINWRDDPSEPGTVIITNVVPGSAAALAGLAPKDRICTIGGQGFQGTQELGKLIRELPAPLEMLVERRGQLSEVKVNVLPLEPAP